MSWEYAVWVVPDEMNRRRGHDYLTVFVDLAAKRVLLAVEGKDAGAWEPFADELFQHNGHSKARGYRSIGHMTTLLCFVAGKLEIPYYG